MVEDAKEAVGSMGDDTPLAVIPDTPRCISNFFRQNFSQVTNPPIDSLRETRVMSLKTRFGNLANILDKERSEEHTSELQSLMRISYAVFCLKQTKSTRPTSPPSPPIAAAPLPPRSICTP